MHLAEAQRGRPVKKAISPKYAPEVSVRKVELVSARKIDTFPDVIKHIYVVTSPSSKIISPGAYVAVSNVLLN